jgi:hypothetical protein
VKPHKKLVILSLKKSNIEAAQERIVFVKAGVQ